MTSCRDCFVELSPSNHPAWQENNECSDCYNKRRRTYHREWKMRPQQRVKDSERAKKYHINNYYLTWARGVIGRHRKNGYIIIIDRPTLQGIAEKSSNCALCGVKLSWFPGKRKQRADSPTLDRMNNDHILTKDNIIIICYKCNVAKRNYSLTQFISYVNRLIYNYDHHFRPPYEPNYDPIYLHRWAVNTLTHHRQKFIVNIGWTEMEERAKLTSHCELCGDKLDWHRIPHKTTNHSPTLDRTNNEDVLTRDNISIICMRCNTAKGNLPMDRFMEYLRLISSYAAFGKTASLT